MKSMGKRILSILCIVPLVLSLAGCGSKSGEARIVRIAHNQPTDHPINVALLEFEQYIEERLGDKYNIEIYPNELLGSQPEMMQLTQTGAIDFCVASNSILESFSTKYGIFNLPYLFGSQQAYYAAMADASITEPIFKSTRKAGFEGVTWMDAGSRSFYTVNKEINKPEDLKGLKIRVQQSPSNVEMMNRFGGSATPMNFGEVYTALQSGVIDGAENNELALTANGHGDVCKYYSYDMHQMIPDVLVANCAFLDDLSEEEKAVFEEGYKIFNARECELFKQAIEDAKKVAAEEKGVTFIYPDTAPFKEVCLPMHQNLLDAYPDLQPIYDAIQAYNAQYVSNGQ